jgi:hypothetical protein
LDGLQEEAVWQPQAESLANGELVNNQSSVGFASVFCPEQDNGTDELLQSQGWLVEFQGLRSNKN